MSATKAKKLNASIKTSSKSKKLILVLVILLVFSTLSAATSRFHLSKPLDISLSAGSIALVGANYAWAKAQTVPTYSGTPATAQSELNFLDKNAIFQYNATLDKASTISTIALLAAPSVFIFNDSNYFTYGLMYFETIAMTYGLKELCKNLVERQRPYLYNAGYPEAELSNGDYTRSFPSGHTALAFASATYLSTVLTLDRKDSAYRIPVIVASYVLAATVATTRVLSGNHYITDILAGALLGSLCGVAIPLLHTMQQDSTSSLSGVSNSAGALSVSISPAGVYLGVRL